MRKLNQSALESFPGKEYTFLSADSVGPDDNPNHWPLENLHQEQPSGMPPHELKLKRFAPITLLRNLDPSNGKFFF